MITREPYPYRRTVPILEEAVEDGRVERGVVRPERGRQKVRVREKVLRGGNWGTAACMAGIGSGIWHRGMAWA